MNKKLSSKVLNAEESSKLLTDFNVDDISVRDTSELQVYCALLNKVESDLKFQLSEVGRSSGYDNIVSAINDANSKKKFILSVLSKRVSDDEVNDQSMVELKKDVVTFSDSDDESSSDPIVSEETDSNTFFSNDSSYRINTFEEFNESCGSNCSEESYYHILVPTLFDLGLGCVICFGKRYLSEFDSATARDILDKNLEWGTVAGSMSVNKTKLNANLGIYHDKRDQLLIANLIVKDYVVKMKDPTARQLSLFDSLESESVSTLVEGGDNDVEE